MAQGHIVLPFSILCHSVIPPQFSFHSLSLLQMHILNWYLVYKYLIRFQVKFLFGSGWINFTELYRYIVSICMSSSYIGQVPNNLADLCLLDLKFFLSFQFLVIIYTSHEMQDIDMSWKYAGPLLNSKQILACIF